jgi:hypothetical protein
MAGVRARRTYVQRVTEPILAGRNKNLPNCVPFPACNTVRLVLTHSFSLMWHLLLFGLAPKFFTIFKMSGRCEMLMNALRTRLKGHEQYCGLVKVASAVNALDYRQNEGSRHRLTLSQICGQFLKRFRLTRLRDSMSKKK